MDNLGYVSLANALRALIAVLALVCAPLCGFAQAADAPALAEQVKQLAEAGTQNKPAGVTRVDIQVGQLDSRLHLAPCQKVEPYLPAGARLWGRTRIGLRCVQGTVPWNVYMPVIVKIYGQALVATAPLAVGTVVTAADITQAEVDLAEDSSAAVADSKLVVGRTLARAINPGQSLRQAHLKARQWFQAGETVKLVAVGAGFSVSSDGEALSPGIEGQPARIKTESGRVLTGLPAGDHRVELAL
jgi:flagella basal body P-ring formation protein FlgA